MRAVNTHALIYAATSAPDEAVHLEDLSAVQDYDGLQVINPFADVIRS